MANEIATDRFSQAKKTGAEILITACQSCKSAFLNQSSKDNTQIFMSSQNILQVDLRVRKNLHRLTQCSRQLLVNNEFQRINDDYRKLPLEITKRLYIKAETFKMSNVGTMPIMKNQPIEYIKASSYYDLYNTCEKIKPVIK